MEAPEQKESRHIVLGTAGHIDHGKTSLVKCITGVNTDRLAEEKRRGITIELGFAPWQLRDDMMASIVDVPGHERLVRTMVAGAAGMDLAMLVVAADDGVMPQTREHLDVLRLLNVPAGVVVLTKCDLADPDILDMVEEDVRDSIQGSIFENAPFVRTSSKSGMGIDALREAVIELASGVEARSSEGPAFLPLDRLFSKAGHGTVGTGTTLRGTLRAGDLVDAFGDGVEAIEGLKIRGLQALGAQRETVEAGMRTAANITGRNADQVKRGMVIATAGAFRTVDSCVVWAEALPHAEAVREETLVAHLGTTEREARVIPLRLEQLEPGDEGGLLLRFERPVAAYAGQRLVLRRPGIHGQATVAGGVVLDPEPPRGKGAVSLAASQLDGLRGDPKERLLAIARESRAAGVGETAIARRLPPGVGGNTARSLEKKGRLLRVPGNEPHFIDTELAKLLVRKVVAMVDAHHDASPMSPGIVEGEVETRLPPPERHLAATLIARAVAEKKLIRDGSILAVNGRGGAIDEDAKVEMAQVHALFIEASATPPFDKALASELGLEEARVRELLAILRRQKKLTKVADGLHYDAAFLDTLGVQVADALAVQGEMTASALKEVIGGVSRKWAIPIFEFLDKSKITVRNGDVRKLHPSRAQLNSRS